MSSHTENFGIYKFYAYCTLLLKTKDQQKRSRKKCTFPTASFTISKCMDVHFTAENFSINRNFLSWFDLSWGAFEIFKHDFKLKVKSKMFVWVPIRGRGFSEHIMLKAIYKWIGTPRQTIRHEVTYKVRRKVTFTVRRFNSKLWCHFYYILVRRFSKW